MNTIEQKIAALREKQEFSKWLKIQVSELPFSEAEFCRIYGLNISYFNKIKNGQRVVGKKYIERLYDIFSDSFRL